MLQSAISDVAQYNSRCCTVQHQMMDCATSDVVQYSTNKSKEPSKATNPPTKEENRPPAIQQMVVKQGDVEEGEDHAADDERGRMSV